MVPSPAGEYIPSRHHPTGRKMSSSLIKPLGPLKYVRQRPPFQWGPERAIWLKRSEDGIVAPLFPPRTHGCGVLDTEGPVARSTVAATELDSVVRERYLGIIRVDEQPKRLADQALIHPCDRRRGYPRSTAGFTVNPSAHKQNQLYVVTADGYTVDPYAKRRPCWRFDRRLCKLGSVAQPELIRSGVSQ